MLKQLCGAVVVLALSACANSERLMDASVRPSDHADCLVGRDRGEPVGKGASPSMRSRHSEAGFTTDVQSAVCSWGKWWSPRRMSSRCWIWIGSRYW